MATKKTATIELNGSLTSAIHDGHLVVSLPYNSKGKASASGKSLIVASTRGNQSISLDGEVVMLGVNAYKKV